MRTYADCIVSHCIDLLPMRTYADRIVGHCIDLLGTVP